MLNITLRGLYRPVAFACRHRAYHLKRNFLPAFSERGIIADMFPHEAGNELAAHLDSSTRTVYAGFDPTADSLHLGNLLVLNALLHSLRAGHNVIALIGGATAMIGDPSGKNEERPEMSGSQVANNVRGITDDLKRIFENHAKFFSGGRELSDARIVDNNDWYKERNLLHFLSTTGRHFRLGRMMARDSVKKRIESGDGISLTEFSYQVFQAYDWYHLNRAFQCTVQFGGSDQMGNMTAGYDLCSRALDLTVYSVTLPLVTSESGEKLGKTAGASVWLSEERTSCFDFYRRHDNEIEKMLKLFSFCSDSEISGK
jgi:tyrosyl-tRNA synthetase